MSLASPRTVLFGAGVLGIGCKSVCGGGGGFLQDLLIPYTHTHTHTHTRDKKNYTDTMMCIHTLKCLEFAFGVL